MVRGCTGKMYEVKRDGCRWHTSFVPRPTPASPTPTAAAVVAAERPSLTVAVTPHVQST